MAKTTIKLRSLPVFNLNPNFRIDREKLMIYDVVAMQAGVEAIGHGVEADTKTLQIMAELGNKATRNGIRGRFGHPGASENAAGKKVMTSRNFRVDGDKLRHDVHLLSSAALSPVFARSPIDYILDIAENAPGEMAESAVVDTHRVWTFADGSELDVDNRKSWPKETAVDQRGRPVHALTKFPVIRPIAFAYLDVVNEGALTHDGLFGAEFAQMMFSGTANEYAEEVFQIVDSWRAEYNIPLDAVPDKVQQVLSRYMAVRGQQESSMAKRVGQGTGGVVVPRRTIFDTDAGTPPGNAPVKPDGDDELDEALVEDDSEAVNDDTEEEADEVDSALDDAIDEGDDGEAEAVAPAAPAEAAMSARMAALEQIVVKLQKRTERLAVLALRQRDTIRELKQDVRFLSGEPVVSSNLSGMGQSSSFARGVSSLTPPQPLRTQKPGSVTQAQPKLGGSPLTAYNFDDNPEDATLQAMTARQRQLQTGQQ